MSVALGQLADTQVVMMGWSDDEHPLAKVASVCRCVGLCYVFGECAILEARIPPQERHEVQTNTIQDSFVTSYMLCFAACKCLNPVGIVQQ